MGSEMCIRDRRHIRQTREGAGREQLRQQRPKVLHLRRRPPSSQLHRGQVQTEMHEVLQNWTRRRNLPGRELPTPGLVQEKQQRLQGRQGQQRKHQTTIRKASHRRDQRGEEREPDPEQQGRSRDRSMQCGQSQNRYGHTTSAPVTIYQRLQGNPESGSHARHRLYEDSSV